MPGENANAVETGRDCWRRAGWTDGLAEKERPGSGVGATLFGRVSAVPSTTGGAGFALMDLLSMEIS